MNSAERQIWESCALDIAGPGYGEGLLPVSEPLENAADLWGAMEDALILGKISQETYQVALDLLGEVARAENPNAAIVELSYVEDFDGLKLQLRSRSPDR